MPHCSGGVLALLVEGLLVDDGKALSAHMKEGQPSSKGLKRLTGKVEDEIVSSHPLLLV